MAVSQEAAADPVVTERYVGPPSLIPSTPAQNLLGIMRAHTSNVQCQNHHRPVPELSEESEDSEDAHDPAGRSPWLLLVWCR